MSGFVSSFNVSVAAALVFYEARRARLECLGHHCDLSEREKQILTAVMLLRHQVVSFLAAEDMVTIICCGTVNLCCSHQHDLSWYSLIPIYGEVVMMHGLLTRQELHATLDSAVSMGVTQLLARMQPQTMPN